MIAIRGERARYSVAIATLQRLNEFANTRFSFDPFREFFGKRFDAARALRTFVVNFSRGSVYGRIKIFLPRKRKKDLL